MNLKTLTVVVAIVTLLVVTKLLGMWETDRPGPPGTYTCEYDPVSDTSHVVRGEQVSRHQGNICQ